MRSTLSRHLVEQFAEIARPQGWTCTGEAPLFDDWRRGRLGFQSYVDLSMRRDRDGARICLEIEISRADPVANQVKAWIAREVGALGRSDVLIGLFSSAIEANRRNLSAAYARRLRASGVPMFLVSLLPALAPERIRRLNHSPTSALQRAALPLAAELARVLAVAHPRAERVHRIHFAGDASDAVANALAWNDQMAAEPDASWRRRYVQFFVFDPVSRVFAPSKFCAFIPAPRFPGDPVPETMTLGVYATLGEQDPRFDGHVARRHLCNALAFREVPFVGDVEQRFEDWRTYFGNWIGLRGRPRILLPPAWYRRPQAARSGGGGAGDDG